MTTPTPQERLSFMVRLINRCTRDLAISGTSEDSKALAITRRIRDDVYHDQLCPLARSLGYEWLPFPAVPHWQRASDGGGLWLEYAPQPRRQR